MYVCLILLQEKDAVIDEKLTEPTNKANLLQEEEYEMVLPSGAVIGHRSLQRYYKQRLRPQCAMVKKSEEEDEHLVNTCCCLECMEAEEWSALCKSREVHVLKQAQAKWSMKLGCKANKLQKHFRQQNSIKIYSR